MAADSKLDLLHSIPLFAQLNKSDLSRLGQLTDEIDVAAGRVLMREGESGSEMFVIADGRVKVERNAQLLSELGPGDWFGEMALLLEGARNATVTATEPARLLVVGHADFHSLMDELPSVRTAVISCLADRLRASGAEATS